MRAFSLSGPGTIFWLAILATCAVGVGPEAASGQGLVPHRAVYDLKHVRVSARSGIAAIEGLMTIEFSGAACEGFTSNVRIALKIRRRNGRARVSDLKSTSWESGDGLSFKFGTRQALNGRMQEYVSGRVKMPGSGKTGKGVILKPRARKFDVPATTIFPTEYTLRVIEMARGGKTLVKALVFDGTEKDKTVQSIALIGKRKPAGTDRPGRGDKKFKKQLAGVDAWTVDVSYFPNDTRQTDQTPSYRSTMLLYDNGVTTDMRMVYEDFTLHGELRFLEYTKRSDC